MSVGATRTLWLTPQYVRANSVINDNVDGEVISASIRIAEDKYVHSLLGSVLYSALSSKVTGNTLTGNYLTLMNDYIVPCLLQYTIYECVPFLNFKFRNTSISKQNTPNSEPASLDELGYIRDNVRDTAQYYGERLITYLLQNASSFPEYNQRPGLDDLNPNKDDYFNGIHVPRRRGYWRDNNTQGMGYTHPIN